VRGWDRSTQHAGWRNLSATLPRRHSRTYYSVLGLESIDTGFECFWAGCSDCSGCSICRSVRPLASLHIVQRLVDSASEGRCGSTISDPCRRARRARGRFGIFRFLDARARTAVSNPGSFLSRAWGRTSYSTPTAFRIFKKVHICWIARRTEHSIETFSANTGTFSDLCHLMGFCNISQCQQEHFWGVMQSSVEIMRCFYWIFEIFKKFGSVITRAFRHCTLSSGERLPTAFWRFAMRRLC
jgi:hypothetical protein